jgi:outer membrane biosynthesis protein TonB
MIATKVFLSLAIGWMSFLPVVSGYVQDEPKAVTLTETVEARLIRLFREVSAEPIVDIGKKGEPPRQISVGPRPSLPRRPANVPCDSRRVDIKAVIQADGTGGPAQVTNSVEPAYEEPVLTAFKQWKFSPATLDGRPVPVIIKVEMNFDARC